MRWALIVLIACGKSSSPPKADRWPEVEKAAVDLVPAADGTALRATLDRIGADDVPETAIEAFYAWAAARGGWPGRGQHAIVADNPLIKAARLANAALERRASDPQTVPSVLYLAQRLRGEGGCLLDSVVGFDLVKNVREKVPGAAVPKELAPTEAEIRRAIAVDAVCGKNTMDEAARHDPAEAQATRDMRMVTERALQDLVLELPADIRAAPTYLARGVAKYKDHPMASMLMTPRLDKLTQSMLDIIDGKQSLPSTAEP
jgi:hypothetical protein